MNAQSAAAALRRAVEKSAPGPVALLCIGNPLRGDDGFGPAVFRTVGQRSAAHLFNGGETPENVLPAVARLKPRLVIAVDAVVFGGAPGELALLEPGGMRTDGFDTHTASLTILAEFINESCGAEVLILAAQPHRNDFGIEMSTAVKSAVDRAADMIAAAIPPD